MSNLRWTIRWHLKQRRPRPEHTDTIDHLIAATRNLLLIAAIIAIGG